MLCTHQKSHKLDVSIMLIFVFGKNRPLLLAKGVCYERIRLTVAFARLNDFQMHNVWKHDTPLNSWVVFIQNLISIFNAGHYIYNILSENGRMEWILLSPVDTDDWWKIVYFDFNVTEGCS